ncbi:MAG: hypothetical protein ILP19_06760, partial [Oscillospiraceae bacterium]|nr:hypothetical protein [Oscillospiraceae bacterium]
FDWQFAKNLYQNAVSVINRFYGSLTHSSDDYGNMGFSENSRFFSSLGANDDMVLCIEADRANLRDLRLVGCMSSEFDGTGWIFDSEGQEFSRKLDTMETATAVRKYTTSYRSDYLETVNLRCENLYYNTRYVFSPAKIRYENTRRRNKNIRDRNGCILSDKKMYYQDVYTVSAYTLNYANPHLEELLTDAAPIAEDEWSLTVSGEGGGEACTYEDYLGYRNNIHSRSYGVSDEVADILDMIQDGSQSRYETAKRLEAYLAGMEYTTDCPPLPDDISSPADFLDFFLLSSRKGYCMHFATAYVLMANEMGIPCRYVQGYNVPRDADGRFIVRQSGAHSWPEVYFDNAGWVAFEPTPGFTVSSGWMTKEDYEADADDDKYKEYLERYKKENETFTEPDVPEEEPVRTDPLIFIIPVSAVIGFLLIFYIISRILSARRYRRMSPDGRFSYVSQKCLRFLGYLGLGMNENETLSEYRQRLITLDRQDITDSLGFIPAYERALYSDSGITESDVGEAEKTNSTLRELVKKKLRLRLLLLITNQ